MWQVRETYSHHKKYQSFPFDQAGLTESWKENPEIQKKIKILPQNAFNAYYKLTNEETLRSFPNWNNGQFKLWQEGDFLVHFTGYNYRERLDLMMKFDKEIKR